VLGATTVVWRRGAGGEREWLVLHRAHRGPAYAGDWAWTSPGGGREPGESPAACARRELREETGLELACAATPCGEAACPVFAAEAPPDARVRLDAEHDAHRWLPLAEACALCLPARVGRSIGCVAAWLDGRDAGHPE
jgi:8-oxo-dGTP pyrophosphatase MutT (NUDIX family)